MTPDRDIRTTLEAADLVDALREVVAIPSFEREEEVARWVADQLVPAGFRATETPFQPGRPIVAFRIGSGRPELLLAPHMDTVPPGDGWDTDPFALTRKGTRLHGRGASDDKGPLVAAVFAARALAEAGLPRAGTLTVLCLPAEEEASQGVRAFVREPVEADAAIVCEPSDNVPCIAHKGLYWTEIAFEGRAAHASQPADALSAIEGVRLALDDLPAFSAELAKRTHPLLGPATVAATRIDATGPWNIIPSRATLGVDRRAVPGENVDRIVPEIAERVRALGWPGEVSARLVEFNEPAETDAAEPVVVAATAAASDVLGRVVAPAGFTASCDMWVLRNHASVPTIVMGPGHLAQAHKANEFIDEASLRTGALVYARAAERFFEISG